MGKRILLHCPGNKTVSLYLIGSQNLPYVVIFIKFRTFGPYIAFPCNGTEMYTVN